MGSLLVDTAVGGLLGAAGPAAGAIAKFAAPAAAAVGKFLPAAGKYIASAAKSGASGVQAFANGARKAGTTGTSVANAADDGVGLALRYKPGWSATQRSAADAKVAALNDAAGAGTLRVTQVQRASTSAASRYRSAGGIAPRGADIDHTIDLQLGGVDDITNMIPLDMSVNRSLGSQIMWQLRGVEVGTCVIAVKIC